MDLASAMQLSSAALGALAAIAWGLSAIGKVPSPSSGWGADPFRAMTRSSRLSIGQHATIGAVQALQLRPRC